MASVWRAPLWLRLWKYAFRSVELKCPIGNVFFRGYIQGLMDFLFVPQDVLFQMAMKHNSFFTWRNSLEVFCPRIP